MTVGSVCSSMPSFRRLTKTPAIMSRSDGWPVSFSTIDAMISASYGVLYGRSGARVVPRVLQQLHLAPIRLAQDVEVGGAGVVDVGVRREQALRMRLGGADGLQQVGVRHRTGLRLQLGGGREQRAQFAERDAFHHRELLAQDVARLQLVEQSRQRDAALDRVAARAQVRRRARSAAPPRPSRRPARRRRLPARSARSRARPLQRARGTRRGRRSSAAGADARTNARRTPPPRRGRARTARSSRSRHRAAARADRQDNEGNEGNPRGS